MNVRIKDLISVAFEGGSNYWYMIKAHNKKEVKECEYLSELLFYPEGWMVISDDNCPGGIKVTHQDLIKGFEIFSTNPLYKKHYVDFLNDNEDADTADILLQLTVFKEVIYG